MNQRQLNSTNFPIPFLMVNALDHQTGMTGLTPTVTISKNGGAFAAPSGTVTEIGNGWYVIAGNAADRDTIGDLIIHATATGADPLDGRLTIVPWNPFDGAALGLTRLNATITSRLALADYSVPPAITDIVTAIFAKSGLTAGGSATFADILKILYAIARGKATHDLQTGTTTYTDDDGTTVIHQATMSQADNLETRTPAAL
jgi:hypothetical protein